MEPNQEITMWLTELHLPQYATSFTLAGYHFLKDLRNLNEEKLLEMDNIPTGHRRRILSSLETLMMEVEGSSVKVPVKRKPIPRPRQVLSKDKQKEASTYQHAQAGNVQMTRQTLPARTTAYSGTMNVGSQTLPRIKCHAASSGSSSTSDNGSSESLENFTEDHVTNKSGGLPADGAALGFQGEMVENEIYEECLFATVPSEPRSTRSFKLRHRPVPEIPEHPFIPSYDRNVAGNNNTDHLTRSEGLILPPSHQKASLERTLSPISPYGELFLFNSAENVLDLSKDEMSNQVKETLEQQKLRHKQTQAKEKVHYNNKQDLSKQHIDDDKNVDENDYDDYSTVQASSFCQQITNEHPTPPTLLSSTGPSAVSAQSQADVNVIYSLAHDDQPGLLKPSVPPRTDLSISPYACFYGICKTATKAGWLDKLSPQGNCVFQRRWVKLEGGNLTYYNSEKEMYSKGLIPLSAVKQIRALGENKFEVVTTLRTFVFRAEKEGDRQDWLEVLQAAVSSQSSVSHQPRKNNTNKSGYVELRGLKGRVYLSLMGTCFRLCKTDQDFNAGLAIAVVDLTAACVKQFERKGLEITTPFKSFCFTVESEHERDEWIEAVQESIVETLCNYEVLEKVWFNKSNRKCADCQAPEPEWASINLCVVICKNCAGQHRFLGPGISKVRSMKLDSSIWTNELIELFLEVGNKNSNSLWVANLPPEDELCKQSSTEQRASFIRRKYKKRKYKKVLNGLNTQEELNKALCAAVVLPDVLQTMALVFSGADVMCATGDPELSTPYLLAQKAGQRLQMEFLYHNKLSDFPKLEAICDSSFAADAPSFMDGFLYCSANAGKATLDRKGKPDMVRRWCTLEGGFLSYYDNEKIATPIGRVDIGDVVSLAINNNQTITETGPVFTFELYLRSQRVLVFGVETSDAHQDWTNAIAKSFVPPRADALLRQDSELIGRLYYKEGHDLYHWRIGWFTLVGSELYFCSGDEDEEEGVLQLKRLQELTVSTHIEGDENIQVLLMVESGRTLYIHCITKQDFALWHSAIQLAAGTDGMALSNQQMNKNDVPIIVDSCIAFVTQYGLCYEGIYQKKGDPGRVAHLIQEFTKDARVVKLRVQEQRLEDVTDTLKSFLSHSEDALLAKELYPFWISALDEQDEKVRVQKYSSYIQSLPKVNRSTLGALLQHLYRIQRCSHINQMSSQRLACVFSSCLFQTEGHTAQETQVVEDLINNYIQLFSVNDEQVRQMEKENSFITRWKDTTFSPAGDLIFEAYLEKKEPEKCCLIKISPNMRSDELAVSTLEMKGMEVKAQDLWTTFEVIENGEMERPLHYKEKVLEQVLEWRSLEDPSSAFLLIKKYSGCKMTDSNSDKLKDFIKGEHLKFKDGSSKLLLGNKFQDRYLVLQDKKLLLYKDIKSTKPEREAPLKAVKCYFGLRRKLKPTSSWGFTVYTEKQQWYFCCKGNDSQQDWVTSIIRMKHGSDLWPRDLKQSTSLPYNLSRRRTSTQSTTQSSNKNQREVKGKSVLTTSTEDSNTQNQMAADEGIRPDSLHKLASAEGTPGVSRLEMVIDDTLQSQRRASLQQDTATLTQISQRKAAIPGRGVQLPQNLINELSTVLNKTGRSQKEAD
ncbi:arf-GAP with Rho-GAP domain, ANK repeat and PH domain-containing protein 2 isoform X1 [Danio rerio]|uniref:Arf-GAP with Rho-GAP domain, ANK repeat and PH domain-containing protein 2 n=2 Tax=Danio rerio TaxID=7955 RepID=E7F7Y0_DANRE|nr:arf-GAP with Rho-GAP domain, ANK repeat and PH domain-containing protein 2 [Danio rerio]XP_009301839.1 arf-GAP with Rho-GAP domain, ANK repeat and PH domain-containing protein 2 [Danio rerio]XP_021333689.1 arf-GAP with Rho-GAP domain, ANK repeat and PH domain-containing protein 2 [Danio rerio]|eukprot:XP_009301838.1 arf-GAP with Rho-GAP domain, ANK repeat and PH domain-containing protein 2 [Danio rerio]